MPLCYHGHGPHYGEECPRCLADLAGQQATAQRLRGVAGDLENAILAIEEMPMDAGRRAHVVADLANAQRSIEQAAGLLGGVQ